MKQLNHKHQFRWGAVLLAFILIVNLPCLHVSAQNRLTNNEEIAADKGLLTFDANAGYKSSNLFWVSSANMHAGYFIVERSRDGRIFQDAGMVQAIESNNRPQQYNWTDLYPFPVTFYRLKSVDKNGKQAYSKLVKLVSAGESLRISPTIIRDHINFYALRPMPKVRIDIRELSGKSLIQQTVSINSEYRLNTWNLKPGLYIVTVLEGYNKYNFEIFKQ